MRKTQLSADQFECTLRRWSVVGAILGIVAYLVIVKFTGWPRYDIPLRRWLTGVGYMLMGIIIARLLATVFFDKES